MKEIKVYISDSGAFSSTRKERVVSYEYFLSKEFAERVSGFIKELSKTSLLSATISNQICEEYNKVFNPAGFSIKTYAVDENLFELNLIEGTSVGYVQYAALKIGKDYFSLGYEI